MSNWWCDGITESSPWRWIFFFNCFHCVISVFAEISSYWLALLAVLSGGYLVLRNQERSVAPIGLVWRCLGLSLALVIVVASWISSDQRFFVRKLGSIRAEAWPQIVSDLESYGRQTAQTGKSFAWEAKRLPKSLQQLGSIVDYGGVTCNVWNTPEYKGVFAVLHFGYKGRNWGLCLGPESKAKECGRYVRVATNAFFFVSSRD